jgi:type II restriction/modification system DNA methylase subunit YeeA
LGDEYTKAMWQLYEGRVPGAADLVTYWFERARTEIERKNVKRAGLLATQAIRAGANRQVLERIKQSGDIFYAQADRPWIQEGAAVRVSMVGFDDGSETDRRLNINKDDLADVAYQNAKQVEIINADLTSLVDLTQAHQLPENGNLCFQGPVKVGAFDIDAQTALEMLAVPNPHGRPNSDVVKPWMNASDVTRRPRGMFIIDFDELELEDASLYEAPFEYVRDNIKSFRESNNDKQRRSYWWRLGRSGKDLKLAKDRLTKVIITPRVSKHRMFVWADGELLPDSRLFAIAREDDYFFGVLHSRIHEIWSLATSSRHGVGNDPTYNNTTCFETFPFPWPPGKEPKDDPRVEAIAEAARELVEKRNHWLNPPGLSEKELKQRTLTNLYNQRPTWLAMAHEKLDRAVLAAYGWPHELGDEEILERLLALNLERAGG